MPLLVPLVIALLVAAAASLLWVWSRYIAHRRYGGLAAAGVVALTAAGVWLLVASDGPDATVPAAAGWISLGAAAVALAAAWFAIARWAPRR